MSTASALTKLIHELSKLPGVGEKSATRLAFHLLNADEVQVHALADALVSAKQNTRLCGRCYTFSEAELCDDCQSDKEDTAICVVERPNDVAAIEATGKHKGYYHVLHGTLSPIEGIGPDNIRIKELIERVTREQPREIILALNPSVECESTALYITKMLQHFEVNVSKIAYGLPMGGSLEFADRMTIGRALDNRQACL